MKSIEVVCIFALVACFIGYCACISSGTSVTNEYGLPYQAAVLCPVIMCSGALVSLKSVLTTASCVNGLLPAQIEVVLGSNRFYSGGYTSNVGTITIHPNFDKSTYDYNIAVLGFTTALTSASASAYNIAPIALATAQPPTNVYSTVSAFGATDSNLSIPDTLQRAFLLMFPSSVCQKYKPNRITPRMFCVGDTTGKKDLCPADQGAPLVYNNQLYGIFSWGGSCGLAAPNPSTPVFNFIAVLSPWIQSTIAANGS